MVKEARKAKTGTRQARPPPEEPDKEPDDNEPVESVDIETLEKYNMIIYLPALGTNDWDVIMDYLDQGGKMFIADGYFMAEAMFGSNEFVGDYVGAETKGISQDTRIVGVDDDPISDGMEMDLESFGQTTIKSKKSYLIDIRFYW